MGTNVIRDPASPASADGVLLVMLPGAAGSAQDLVDRGFVRAARARAPDVDVVAADVHFDHYLEASVVSRLEQDVIGPARGDGHARVWLMGISLGGMGALAYARERPGEIEGVVLLAPFLGTRGLIAEVTRAGGLAQWRPGMEASDPEHALLLWLQSYRAGAPAVPRIHLGYGTEDRYAPASRMLAALLPDRQVVALEGGHDWPTWLRLWERLLESGMLSDKRAVPAQRAASGGASA